MRCRFALAATAAAGVLIAGCGYTGSHAQQVREWASANSYVANERQVVADARALELAVAKGSAKQLRTVCGGLSADAGTLYSTLTTPDHSLTDQINAAMQSFFVAAESCGVATSTSSSAVRKDSALVRSGLAELARANRHISEFGVHA